MKLRNRSSTRRRDSPNTENRRRQRSVFGIIAALKLLGVPSLNRRLIWIASCSLVSGLSQATILIIISELAVSSVEGRDHLSVLGKTFSSPDSILICVALLATFSVASLTAAFASCSMTSAAIEAIRGKVINSFFTASWGLQSSERLGHVQQLLTVNCENVAYITMAISTGLQALLSVLAMLIAAFLVDPVIAVVVLLAGLILSAGMRPFLGWSRKASARLSKDIETMATLVTEFTRLTREFRVMGVEDSAIDRLQQGNHQAAISSNRNRWLMQTNPVIYQIVALGFILLGLAIFLGHTGTSLGSTGAVILLMLRTLTYGSGVQASSQILRSYEGFLDGVEADIERYRASPDEVHVGKVPEQFDVVFDDVSFAYSPETYALRNISLVVPGGKILGVVGRSGSGKTTLSQLALGMRKPGRGRVLLGDVPAASVYKGNGSSPIALVAQESVLLQGSVAMNIAFFRQVSQEEIEMASRAAHLHEDVLEMADLYETQVGEGGGSLSGGQGQRLAIARALVGSPRLLVLDEPTSALDGRSENLVRRTLSELRGRVTVIVISHRMAMVEDCDLLLVLEKGKIADVGPREEVVTRAAFRYVAEAEGDQSVSPNLLK